MSPYNFVANTPIQAVDPDGKVIIFVNGFMKGHWEKGYSRNPSGRLGGWQEEIYAPDRGFYKDGPKNDGRAFKEPYWGGVNQLYIKVLLFKMFLLASRIRNKKPFCKRCQCCVIEGAPKSR